MKQGYTRHDYGGRTRRSGNALLDKVGAVGPPELERGMAVPCGGTQQYYLQDTNRCLFSDVTVRYPQYNLDYYTVLGCLCSCTLQESRRYHGCQRRFLSRPPNHVIWTRANRLFTDIRSAMPHPQPWTLQRNA